MEAAGIIRKSNSVWDSRVVLVVGGWDLRTWWGSVADEG